MVQQYCANDNGYVDPIVFNAQLADHKSKKILKKNRGKLKIATTNLRNILHIPTKQAELLASVLLLNENIREYAINTKYKHNVIADTQDRMTEYLKRFLPFNCSAQLDDYIAFTIIISKETNFILDTIDANEHTNLHIFVKREDLFRRPKGRYQIYQWFNTERSLFYTGLTGRSVLTRLSEHLSADSLFGSILQQAVEDYKDCRVSVYPALGIVREFGLDRKTAFRREAELIQAESLYPKGQNLSPGGEAGARLYYNLGYTNSADYTKITDDEYEKAEIKLNVTNYRKKNNLNDKFIKYAKIEITDAMRNRRVFGNAKNLNRSAVNQIKLLRLAGYSLGEVYDMVKEFGNFSQIEKVYKGKTFYWDTWAE